jgi:ABC-type transport system substrate-binding protein
MANNKTTAKTAIFSTLFLAVVLAVIFAANRFMSSQDNSKNTIRVLIDRYPQSQLVDGAFQKIQPLIDEFHYQLTEFPSEERMVLSRPNRPSIEFTTVRDEVTRALLFLRGDADILYDTLSLAKTEWARHQRPDLQVFEKEGARLSYLGFQASSPTLKDRRVREAIIRSLPINEWIHYKFFNWVTRTDEVEIPSYDPGRAAELLDSAGYPIKNGQRFSLRYLTTPVREGNETAQLVREALKQIGITVVVTTIETSLYFSKMQQGDADLFSSLWVRPSRDAPAIELLGKGQRRNYTHFSSVELESIFEKRPNTTLREVAPTILNELPLMPLYNWKHGLITASRIRVPADIDNSLDESFRFLARLEIK